MCGYPTWSSSDGPLHRPRPVVNRARFGAALGLSVRSIAVEQPRQGLAAARRGELCDLAPIHLFDEETESYDTPFLGEGPRTGCRAERRMQGIVFRCGGDAAVRRIGCAQVAQCAPRSPTRPASWSIAAGRAARAS